MPKLKVEKRTVYKVDCSDLEQFVREVYAVEDYSFVAKQECGNDSQHRFHVDAVMDKWDIKEAEALRGGKVESGMSNHTILQTLCVDGHIKPGEYIVDVCW